MKKGDTSNDRDTKDPRRRGGRGIKIKKDGCVEIG